ncbi:MAG: NifU family protein [Cyclobacteriaceae bacterium]|nr:NifU family protein [Cyclobacteriaceae bacterium]
MTSLVNASDQEILQRVEDALNGIRPYLEADGGNVRVVELSKELVLRLEFVGNCGNCPMSSMTFKAGVEEAIRKSVPEIKGVEVINLVVVG